MRIPIIIESGLARFVSESRGGRSLEGFGQGRSFRFERCESDKRRNCRAYPDRSATNYCKTSGEGLFAGYFEPVTAGKEGRRNDQ